MANKDKENATIFSGFFQGTAAAILGVVVALIGIPVTLINVAPDLLRETRAWVAPPQTSLEPWVSSSPQPEPNPSYTPQYESTSSAQSPYPSDAVQSFMDACTAAGGPYSVCKCGLEELQSRYTYQEFQQKVLNDFSGYVVEATAIEQSCQPR